MMHVAIVNLLGITDKFLVKLRSSKLQVIRMGKVASIISSLYLPNPYLKLHICFIIAS